MVESGLVEIASHSYNGHRGIDANPQGNRQPALTARTYAAVTRTYEDDIAYAERINADLQANTDLIEQKLGVRPRVMVWPFGKYSLPAIEAARQAGMPVTLGLGDGPGDTDHLTAVKRLLIEGSLDLPGLSWRIRHLMTNDPQRVVQVDLDYVYDPDPQQVERNLGRLLDRIKAMQITTVYLQAFADPDGDGVADALYFPNAWLPVRADLFNRVAWQLKTRAGVKVYAWLPVLGFVVPRQDWSVQSYDPETGLTAPEPLAYQRLSPFVPEVETMVQGIYEDLARYADFDGLLFMTTNRGDDIDEAILSRCAAIIHYDPPGPTLLPEVWRVMSGNFEAGLEEGLIAELVALFPQITPRDVKMLLRLTLRVARARGEPLSAELFRRNAMFRGINAKVGEK